MVVAVVRMGNCRYPAGAPQAVGAQGLAEVRNPVVAVLVPAAVMQPLLELVGQALVVMQTHTHCRQEIRYGLGVTGRQRLSHEDTFFHQLSVRQHRFERKYAELLLRDQLGAWQAAMLEASNANSSAAGEQSTRSLLWLGLAAEMRLALSIVRVHHAV